MPIPKAVYQFILSERLSLIIVEVVIAEYCYLGKTHLEKYTDKN